MAKITQSKSSAAVGPLLLKNEVDTKVTSVVTSSVNSHTVISSKSKAETIALDQRQHRHTGLNTHPLSQPLQGGLSRALLTAPTSTHALGVGPSSLEVGETKAELAAQKMEVSPPMPGLDQLLIPLAFGFVMPRVEDMRLGRPMSRLSTTHVAGNYANAMFDLTLTGQEPVRDVGMHGSMGALGYLSLREHGHTVAQSAVGAALTGIGIELGQSLEPAHRVSVGDMLRTAGYGVLFGEGIHQITLWANNRFDQTGNNLYRVLGAASYLKVITPGPDAVGVGFSINF